MYSVLGFRVNGVQASAKKYHGYCTWPFSQVVGPVRNLINSHPEARGDICGMLSAKWLEQHAKGGSLIDWMSGREPYEIESFVDHNKVRQLMQLSGSSKQNSATENWLRSNGVIKRRDLMRGMTLLDGERFHQPRLASSHPGRPGFAAAIARDIIQSKGCYKIIGINGPQSTHAIAAWSDDDVSFFDPNFGEYWFAQPQDFVSWLPFFWYSAGYDLPLLSLNSGYVIHEFALAV